MNNVPKILDLVVENDLCTGCGICTYKCPSGAIKMKWNDNGFLIPHYNGKCYSEGDCISVCPFNPDPDPDVKTENDLADIFLNTSTKYSKKVGKYNGFYVGYSQEYRLSSSSGGMATYILKNLLDKGIVDFILTVQDSEKPKHHFEYTILSRTSSLVKASKTKYFPVTMGEVFSKIHDLKGKVAIVGVACFIKAIRLAQRQDPVLKHKIPFLIGIICGGIKSRFYTEYLAGKVEINVDKIKYPQFRIKDLNSSAIDYSFGCFDERGIMRSVKMKRIGDMWGTGFFKANACDFCDDVTSELADISLGDAWFEPYNSDGKGTNVIVTRSSLAEKLVQEGIQSNELFVEEISLNDFLKSQYGSFMHRHTGLSYRIKKWRKNNKLLPPKRYENENVSLEYKIVQKMRLKVRQKSLENWKASRNVVEFDEKMKLSLLKLKIATRINRLLRKYKNSSL